MTSLRGGRSRDPARMSRNEPTLTVQPLLRGLSSRKLLPLGHCCCHTQRKPLSLSSLSLSLFSFPSKLSPRLANDSIKVYGKDFWALLLRRKGEEEN